MVKLSNGIILKGGKRIILVRLVFDKIWYFVLRIQKKCCRIVEKEKKIRRKEKRKITEKGNSTNKETNLKFIKNIGFVSRWDISSLNNKGNMA